MRLEAPARPAQHVAWVVELALVTALLPRLWLRLTAATLGLAVVVHRTLAVPFDAHFLGRAASRFGSGFLDYYDVRQPFDPYVHARMDGVLMIAIFGFTLAVGLAVAARRPLLASLALLVGAGWPATVVTGPDDIRLGAFLLAAILTLLVGLAERPRRRIVPAVAAGALVVVAAFAASSSSAVADRELLQWQRWDFYTRPAHRVGLSYVWSSDYSGFTFPRKKTVVFRAKAPATPASYWRATALDQFYAGRWVETNRALSVGVVPANGRNELADQLLDPSVAHRDQWVRQRVTIAALRDYHYLGGEVPVAYEQGLGADYTDAAANSSTPVPRGRTYDVWSYLPNPSPRELGRSGAYYPAVISVYGSFLDVEAGFSVPAFGRPNRAAVLAADFRNHPELRPYKPLYERALKVVGDHPKSPYAVAVAIEAWLRDSPQFLYDQHPPKPPRGVPALVDFVLRTHRGYCQHYAGAMALMLRYLGVPARVAAGFTSGTYNGKKGEWIVTDHDAHTWVEVWFSGYGWIPFDPTPGRGTLEGSYTVSSPSFDVSGAKTILGAQLGDTKHHPLFDPSTLVGVGGASKSFKAGDVPRLRRSGTVSSGGGSIGAALLRLLAALAAGAVALLAGAKVVLLASRRLVRDPRRVAHACRQELVGFLRDQGAKLPPSATLAELGAAIESQYMVDAGPFVAAATEARFGPLRRARPAAVRARRELRALRRALRRELTRTERTLGFVSVRSLGLAR